MSARRRRRSSCARHGVAFTEHVYDYVEHGGTAESARQLGVPEHEVVKTLVMQDEQRAAADRADARRPQGQHQEPGARRSAPSRSSRASPRWRSATAATWSAAPRRSARARRCRSTSRRAMLALPRICINGGRRGYLVGIDAGGADRACSAPSRCSARSSRPRRQNARDRRIRSITMRSSIPLLAALAAYLIGSLSFAVIVSRAMGLADPRTYGSRQPRRDQRAALGQQGRGGRDPAARRAQGLRAGARWSQLLRRSATGWARARVALVGAGGLPRPPVAGVLPLPGRQGRGDRGRRAARHRTVARRWRRWRPG